MDARVSEYVFKFPSTRLRILETYLRCYPVIGQLISLEVAVTWTGAILMMDIGMERNILIPFLKIIQIIMQSIVNLKITL